MSQPPNPRAPYPFRLGTTSYIQPAGLAENARFLSGRLRDMELVLFALEDGPSNFPSAGEVQALRAAAAGLDFTYTVHLPLDLLDGDGLEHRSMPDHRSKLQARDVIERTRSLEPWAYVAHLDGREFQSSPPGAALRPGEALRRWQDGAARALERVAAWAGGPERLAVENLEGYPLDFLEPVLARVATGRCVDIGHLWRDGHDPLPYLERALERTRVIHLHGVDESGRDHQSLAFAPLAERVRLLAWLRGQAYTGVLTLEVFGEADLESSLQALEEAWERT